MIELVLGVKHEDMPIIVERIGNALGLTFEEHDSVFVGTYFLAVQGKNEYRILENLSADYDDQPEEQKVYDWREENHQDCPLLLHCDLVSSSLSQETQRRLKEISLPVVHIREEEY